VRRIPQPGPEAAVRTSDDGYAVQVAARRSLDDAKREASEVTRRYSALFGGTRPYIVKADVPGKGTYYRVRFGPFAERTQVAGLCQQLKGQGQDCFPVQP
jgi:cell division septation protein DedD